MASERGWQRELKTPGERLASILGSPKFSDIELVFPIKHGSIMVKTAIGLSVNGYNNEQNQLE